MAEKKKTIADKILRAGILVALAHLCLKFAGLIQTRVATQYLDASLYEPIMVVAFAGVINSVYLIGQELIHPTFLSIFMKEKEEHGEEAAWHFTNVSLSFQSLVLLFVTATIACFPDFYIHLFTKWTTENNPEGYKLLRTSLQIMAPSLFFLSLGSTTYIILNGYKKFFLAAFGDASTKICIVIGLVLGIRIFGMDYHALLFSIVIGSAAKVITHLFGMLSKLHYLRPSFDWRNPAFHEMLVLMVPLLVGIIFAKVRDNFNNIYILTHIEQQGVLQANFLGRQLFSTIQWLVPYALQIALYPFLCELVSQNDREKLGEVLGTSSKLLLSVFVPASVILTVLATPIAVLFFLGGKTGIQIASWTGLATACYCLVLPAAAVECVLMQGFFADRRTISVTAIGLVTSFLSIVISYIFIIHVGVDARGALLVVALGFAVTRWVKTFVLSLYIRRKIPMFPARETLVFLAKLTVLAAVVFAATWGASNALQRVLPDGIDAALADSTKHVLRTRVLLRLVASGAAGGIAFLAGAFAIRLKEPMQMVQWALEKVRHKKK
ncbi:MAG: hypothetical protein IJJ26_13620 [Victivallales bacterium]|nr:hypothetical protein [Victivallales bacterium]